MRKSDSEIDEAQAHFFGISFIFLNLLSRTLGLPLFASSVFAGKLQVLVDLPSLAISQSCSAKLYVRNKPPCIQWGVFSDKPK